MLKKSNIASSPAVIEFGAKYESVSPVHNIKKLPTVKKKQQTNADNDKTYKKNSEKIVNSENGKLKTPQKINRKSRRSSSCCFSVTVNKIRYRSVSPTRISKKSDSSITSNVGSNIPSISNFKSNGNNISNVSNIVSVSQLSNRMQLLWYENNVKCCRKLLKYNGCPNKVLLFPEESWARNASSSYLILTPLWWNCSKCKIVEIAGTKKFTTYAKMMDTETGNLCIAGSFKKCADPDFKLTLTSNVTIADFNMGYSMTGSLERGSHKLNNFQMTHFAVIRRAEFNKQ